MNNCHYFLLSNVKSPLLSAILCFTLLFLGLACSPQSQNGTTKQDLVFDVVLGPEPLTLDWHLTRDLQAGIVNINLMDGLFALDLKAKQMKIEPRLAQSYTHNKNFTYWKICLKQKIQWSDGTPLTTEHFLDSWQRALSPKTASPHAHYFFVIKGARDFNLNKTDFSQVAVKKTSQYCLSIELNRPAPHFKVFLSSPYSFPIRNDLIKKYGSAWTQPKNFVGLGAYLMKKNSSQGKLTLKQNQKYHGVKGEVETATIHWMDNKKTALNLFKKTVVDFVKSPNWQDIKNLELQDSMVQATGVGSYFLGFNFKSPLGSNLQFRRSVKNSIEALELEKVFSQDIEISKTLVPWSLWNTKIQNHPSKGRKIQKFEGQKVTLYSNSTPLHKAVMERVAYGLKKTMAIEPQIQLSESASYFSSLSQNLTQSIYRLSFTPGSLTPLSYLEMFRKDSGMNFGQFTSEIYDHNLEQATTIKDRKKRLKRLREIERNLLENQIPAIPLFRHRQSYVIRKKHFELEPHFSERIEFNLVKLRN